MLTWVIQKNLGRSGDVDALVDACRARGCPHYEVAAVPFSNEPPPLPETLRTTPTVFYGATSFIMNVHTQGHWRPGVFFEPTQFTYGRYQDVYGLHLLNADAEHTTLGALAQQSRNPDSEWFIRPETDSKAFAGSIMRFDAIVEWVNRLVGNDLELTPECKIICAQPVGIAEEYRLFIVNGQPVAASRYRTYHELAVQPGAPEDVLTFGAQMAECFSPAPVFVMDVARSAGALYVIELNCFNGSGFYAADINAIVEAVSKPYDAVS